MDLIGGRTDQGLDRDDQGVVGGHDHGGIIEDDSGHEETKIESEDSGRQRSMLKEQLLENGRTWELAKESGAMLYNEEDDIMTILQAQNKEIARKRILAKKKEKMRRWTSVNLG
ncbi:hypothetical protein AHAS_Ahas19G0224500 [Arachis hypogaea]